MKRSPLKNLWLFIYFNFWYIPLLIFLLGIKISLISLLVENLEESRASLTLDDTSGGSGGGWRKDKTLMTNAILKMVNENLKQNQEYLKAHVHLEEQNHQQQQSKIKNNLRQKKDGVPHNNNNNNGYGLGWAAELRQSNQPLTPDDWEILANLESSHIEPTNLNRTDPDSIWLVLNDVPNGGGAIISQLLEDLQDENGFRHLEHEYRTPWPRFLLEEEQKSLVTWFEYQHLPRSYDRHFYFVNFTQFQQYVFENPIYINMVSDPVTRLRSVFKSKRANRQKSYEEVERREQIEQGSGQAWLKKDFVDCVLKGEDPECSYENGTNDFTLMVPFFCGQVNACVILNNKWALQSAKFNIEKYYSVVGVLEKLKESLIVLENYAPRFFSGATNRSSIANDMKRVMEDDNDDNNSNNDDHNDDDVRVKNKKKTSFSNDNYRENNDVDKKVRLTLERKLPAEFELYNFIKARLAKQVASIPSSSTSI